MPDPQQHIPVRLTQAQRKVVAEIAPELADRLKLDRRERASRPSLRPWQERRTRQRPNVRGYSLEVMLSACTGLLVQSSSRSPQALSSVS